MMNLCKWYASVFFLLFLQIFYKLAQLSKHQGFFFFFVTTFNANFFKKRYRDTGELNNLHMLIELIGGKTKNENNPHLLFLHISSKPTIHFRIN